MTFLDLCSSLVVPAYWHPSWTSAWEISESDIKARARSLKPWVVHALWLKCLVSDPSDVVASTGADAGATQLFLPKREQTPESTTDKVHLEAASTVLQSRFRGHLARKHQGEMLKRRNFFSATQIQSAYRGFAVRKDRAEEVEQENRAAIFIQKRARGMLSRKGEVNDEAGEMELAVAGNSGGEGKIPPAAAAAAASADDFEHADRKQKEEQQEEEQLEEEQEPKQEDEQEQHRQIEVAASKNTQRKRRR